MQGAATWNTPLLSQAYAALSDRCEWRPCGADAAQLDRAYRSCAAVTANRSRTFHFATGLFPPAKRRAMRALYAFCRATDDIVDCAAAGRSARLAAWQERAVIGDPPGDDLVATAWAHTRASYRIPTAYARQLIDGVARDLRQDRYATFDELASYGYGVASTVGLMSMHIVGFAGTEAVPYAVTLGVALQMTNILRDVAEDWQAGRVHLPAQELAAFGLSEADLAAGVVDDRWRAFMRFQIARNRQLYDDAWPGIRLLHADGRLAVAAAAALYRAILDDIERHDADVFHRRAHVSTLGKLGRLPALWWSCR